MRRLCLVVIAGLLAACGSDAAPSQLHNTGDPIAVAASPDPAVCAARLRGDEIAATRIRRDLHVDRISTNTQLITFAAADSSATTATLGIPLTPPEEAALQASGIAIDETTAISYWVTVGAPEQFGGLWLDPPGTAHLVVSIVGANADTLTLARCLERRETSYVWAAMSLAAGEALKDRIGNDIQALRAAGIQVNSVDYDETQGIVVVGVTEVLPGMEATLIERYGGPIRVTEEGPVQPL